jgi:CHAD domain-containing protein
LLALASRWVSRCGLWLDVRHKADRGHMLATGLAPLPVTAQAAPVLSTMRPASALAAMLQASLAQVLPNLAAVAQAEQAAPEHVHQLRIGLRRTRSALREFAGGVGSVDPQWEPVLAQAFRSLGPLRDREVGAQLRAAACAAARAVGIDAPGPLAVPPVSAQDTAVLRAPAVQRVLLALIGQALASEAPAHGRPLAEVARRRLSRLHRRVAADGARFAALDDTARHTLRKRMKRLRYSLEFVAPLFPRKRVARYLALLKPAQDALGDGNDVAMAIATCTVPPPSIDAAFVLGWLCARQEALAIVAQARLKALSKAPRFRKD